LRKFGTFLFFVSVLLAASNNLRIKDLKVKIRFFKDGSFVMDEISESQALNEKGAKMLTTDSTPYYRRYAKVSIINAEIRKKNGIVRKITPEYIKDQTMTALQQMNIYEENFRELVVTFPGVKPGDTVFIHKRSEYKPLVKNNFNNVFMLQGFEPIDHVKVIVEGPAEKKLNFIVRNGRLSFRTQSGKNTKIYIWEGENIPALVREPGAPSPLDYGLSLVVSTFKDWKSLSAYGAKLNRGKIDYNSAMKKKVEELTKRAKTEREKIERIFHFVESKIRYMGSSMDVGTVIEPHKATYTFEKKFGVCRDKSILMIAMLKIAGIEAEDVVINVSRRTDPAIPSIYFEHAIVAVKLKDGKVIYMDPTLELSSAFGETYVGDRYVLHLVEGGRDLVKVPHVPADKSLLTIKAKTKISSSGELSSTVNLEGKGFNDFILRTIASKAPGFALLIFYQKLASSLAPGSKLLNPVAGDPFNLDKTYTVRFNVTAKNYTIKAGRFLLFKIPMSKDAFDIYTTYVIRRVTTLEKRRYPLSLFSTSGSRVEEEITIPEGYRVFSLPREIELREGPFYVKAEVTERNGRLFYRRTLLIDSSYVMPEDYSKLKKVLGEMERFKKQMVILEEVK